jgi:hypothetical protein
MFFLNKYFFSSHKITTFAPDSPHKARDNPLIRSDMKRLESDVSPLASDVTPPASDVSPLASDEPHLASDEPHLASDEPPLASDVTPPEGDVSPPAGEEPPPAGAANHPESRYLHAKGALLSHTRRWHGTADKKFINIFDLVKIVKNNQTTWKMPDEMYNTLTSNYDQLHKLISLCKTTFGSKNDRMRRDALLRETVFMCRFYVKMWAYGRFAEGVMNASDIHGLGFLMPGENGGRHKRKLPTDHKPHVTVTTLGSDAIHINIFNTNDEVIVLHGWPEGVRNALFVVETPDGKQEILRRFTTKRHNRVEIPDGHHGEQLTVRAAFLRHVADTPLFGPTAYFTLPIETTDLLQKINQKYVDEIEALKKELERVKKVAGIGG